MATPAQRRLIRVTMANSAVLTAWGEGVHLELTSGMPIRDLRDRACADRFELAVDLRRRGNRLMRGPRPEFRDAVGRYYYAFYHAFRAVSFFVHNGDDHEKHSILPTKIPGNFPQASYWQNMLKDARELRNQADYSPYPKSREAWRADAERLRGECGVLIPSVREYLRLKGCQFV
jgi:hypothetical protein